MPCVYCESETVLLKTAVKTRLACRLHLLLWRFLSRLCVSLYVCLWVLWSKPLITPISNVTSYWSERCLLENLSLVGLFWTKQKKKTFFPGTAAFRQHVSNTFPESFYLVYSLGAPSNEKHHRLTTNTQTTRLGWLSGLLFLWRKQGKNCGQSN